ncbi:FAD-dependent monooxygenase [Streptomyces sp. NBC_00083]|uniref:FAD-dependent monooxygenase n=1 Tax=Streptomyces sp. NBC_00083 TaxID=2975647 RepID=UPI002253493B|nr:FAD-dependent monooxygenase [Streptomyces sp. NBC_00083]MCX5383717.1 FAD-dependent monooxygenase [Streptomyces sp. NBC_00083]
MDTKADRGSGRPRAVVVGGGIGGLTAALALLGRGWRVTVLERAAEPRPVGAGIALAPNGQRALDVIGLGDTVRKLAAWQGDGGLRTPGGRWLARTDARAAAEAFGGPVVLLHRATLIGTLAAALPAGTVRTGAAAELADRGDAGRPAVVRTADGEIEADLVVGADGIHSALRAGLFPAYPGPAYAGFTTWRLVVPAPGRTFPPHETWGPGRLWGTQPLKDGRLYAYAAAWTPRDGHAPDGELAELRRLFGSWHDPVPAVLAAADDGAVLRNDVHWMARSLPAHHRGRVALIGDAAHAMAPTLGQGGNQAIEDAVVLAHHVDPHGDLTVGLAHYSAERMPRTLAVVARAERAAKLAMLRNPAGIAARNALIRALGAFGPGPMLRSLADTVDWQPPATRMLTRQGSSTPLGDRETP